MATEQGETSLLEVGKAYLKEKYQKPGNVYLGVVSRIDKLVTGVIVFARTSKAAARLTRQFMEHTTEKTYLAIVEGRVKEDHGRLENWIYKDDSAMRMRIANGATGKRNGAKKGVLHFRTLKRSDDHSLVAVQLETGRKHQIRLQFAHSGHPILGDNKYKSSERFPQGIALHSLKLSLVHPVSKEVVTFHAPIPTTWNRKSIIRGFDFNDFVF